MELGAGELTVILPDDVTVRWSASVQLGELRLPGDGVSTETQGGIGIEESGVSAPASPRAHRPAATHQSASAS